jgi:hypothetical protein
MTKLINITTPQHRCSIGACPAVLKSEDGKTLTIIGKSGDPRNLPEGVAVGDHEEIIEISAEIVLSALGVTDLIEAAEPIMQALEKREQKYPEPPLPDYFDPRLPRGGVDRNLIERLQERFFPRRLPRGGVDRNDLTITLGQARALRSIIDRIKGGANV